MTLKFEKIDHQFCHHMIEKLLKKIGIIKLVNRIDPTLEARPLAICFMTPILGIQCSFLFDPGL